MNNMTQTSLYAYINAILPNLTDRQYSVLKAINALGECTLKEIGIHIDKPINTFSGRVTELKRHNIIVATGKRRDRCDVLRMRKDSDDVNKRVESPSETILRLEQELIEAKGKQRKLLILYARIENGGKLYYSNIATIDKLLLNEPTLF